MEILITSGATREYIDDVRFITNVSTGVTGAVLAEFLSSHGMNVTLVRGEGSVATKAAADAVFASGAADTAVARSTREQIREIVFRDFKNLNEILITELSTKRYQAVIHLAAVSDYSVEKYYSGKLDSSEDLTLKLKKNFKIVERIKEYSENSVKLLIAFKLTSTTDSTKKTEQITKLFSKGNVDYVVHNDLQNIKNAENTKNKSRGEGVEHKFELFSMASSVRLKSEGVYAGKNKLSEKLIGLIRSHL